MVRVSFVETLEKATDAMTVRRVFGDPVERDGVTVVPVAAVFGGGGGGTGEGPEGMGSGSGGGFGLRARPVGALIIRGDGVSWRPTVDVNRMIVGAQIVVALLVLRAIVRRRA